MLRIEHVTRFFFKFRPNLRVKIVFFFFLMVLLPWQSWV
jgi:hypothetical protein